ncbi:MAG: molybdopterin oxidoreductase family protein [Myxococcales bacterium]
MATVYRTCNVCEAMCGMSLTVEDNRVIDVRPDKDDVFSRGHICPKGPAMREVLEDPDRLRAPMRRTAAGWEPITWRAAFGEAAARLSAVQRDHGRDAVGMYVGNPAVHNHGTILLVQGFQRALRTRNRFDANSQDANPKLFACMMMYGDPLSITVPDVDRTDYFLMLGANPAASGGSLMTLGDVRGRLTGIRKRGGRLVLIDPRRTETAAWADEHHPIRPGGDAAFLLALLEEIFRSGRIDEAALARTTRGLAGLRALALRFPAERVAPAVGLAPEVIRRIAREFAAAERAVAYGRVGICQNAFGATASWLVEALNVVTGNFDRAGGMMFPRPAVDTGALGRKLAGNNHYARWRSRVRGLPEFGGNLPAATMAEEMETDGPGRIRAFVTLAGNPVLSTPNGERLSRALSKLETMVAIDFYLNETTRHAHLILPPVHALEQSHYDLIFHTLAVRNTAKYSPRAVRPAEGAREDWQILYELGMRLGGLRVGPPLLNRALRAAWRVGVRLSPDRLIDLLLRAGPYGGRFVPGRPGLSLRELRAKPHGVDLGPLEPAGRAKVRTADGRVDLLPAPLLADAERVEASLALVPQELVLIGRRHLRTNNSWMHNVQPLVKGPPRDHLLVHPADAARLALREGALARVTSRTGEVTARVSISDEVRAGVVCLPHGYGHAGNDSQRIARAVAGCNINALTDDARLESVVGTAALNGVPVTVHPATGPRGP